MSVFLVSASSKRFFILLSFLLIIGFSSAYAANHLMTVTGVYTGKNLLFSNPVNEDGFGLTIVKVRVNDKIVPYIMDGEVIELDFSLTGIEAGTTVTIRIEYDSSITPIVLNPDNLGAFKISAEKTSTESIDNVFRTELMKIKKRSLIVGDPGFINVSVLR